MARGFTLIELMVVIVLIGIITTIGLPRFLRSPIPLTQDFMHRLNVLIADASAQAQQHNEPRRIFFNMNARTVELQAVGGKPLGNPLTIPEALSIADVVINGESQFHTGTGRTVYFLINPEGMSQEVVLSIEEKRGGSTRVYEFYLNPFSALFRVRW